MLRDILMSYGLLYIEISANTGNRIEYIKGSVEDIKEVFKSIIAQNLVIEDILGKRPDKCT